MAVYGKFYFRPLRGEQIYTAVTPQADSRGSICGRVLDVRGKPVEDALVALFRVPEGEEPALESRFFTDEDGQFLFGPLQEELMYLIKVFKNDSKPRELEIRLTEDEDFYRAM